MMEITVPRKMVFILNIVLLYGNSKLRKNIALAK